MSNQIEGVPDGWQLVRIGHPLKEYYMGRDGIIYQGSLNYCVPIVCKIEKPKQYRPFASAAEFEPHRDRWWYRKSFRDRKSRVTDYCDKAISMGLATWTFKEAFEALVFEDGTPFGVMNEL